MWLVVVTNVASQKDGDEDPGDDPSWKKCTFDYEPCTCNDDGNGPQASSKSNQIKFNLWYHFGTQFFLPANFRKENNCRK